VVIEVLSADRKATMF